MAALVVMLIMDAMQLTASAAPVELATEELAAAADGVVVAAEDRLTVQLQDRVVVAMVLALREQLVLQPLEYEADKAEVLQELAEIMVDRLDLLIFPTLLRAVGFNK